jgi:hypothetical protein
MSGDKSVDKEIRGECFRRDCGVRRSCFGRLYEMCMFGSGYD